MKACRALLQILFALLVIAPSPMQGQQPFYTDDANVTPLTFDFGVVGGRFASPRVGVQLGLSVDF